MYGYCFNGARIKVSKDGYILYAEGISNIIWCKNTNLIDKEIIGLHVNQFTEILRINGNHTENYHSFCENVLPHYKHTLVLPKIYIDDNSCLKNKEEPKQIMNKANNIKKAR